MPNDTLAERIGSALDSAGSGSDEGSSSADSEATTTSGLIGIEDGSPTGGDNGDQGSAQQVALELASSLQPDTVIGTIDGKPVTASEFRDSYFRTQDYTRKTQELAQRQSEAQRIQEWYEGNREYIEGLNSQDANVKRATLEKLAANVGVDLNPRARNERGQFVSDKPDTELYDLEEYVPGTEEYAAAERWNNQVTRNRDLESKLDQLTNAFQQFTTNVTTQVEAQQRRAEAETIAQTWAGSGLQGIDTDGALSLVGKPMSVEQAFRLHHWDKVLRHNYNIAKTGAVPGGNPNEPASSAGINKGSLKGKSLSQTFEERIQ